MDNLIIEKIWEDDQLIELMIRGDSDYVQIYQTCYTSNRYLEEYSKRIASFCEDNKQCYIEMGRKKGNYTPAFSMDIQPADLHGHICIELDFEIADNQERKHRCSFYIHTEIACLERFGKSIKRLVDSEVGSEIRLHE